MASKRTSATCCCFANLVLMLRSVQIMKECVAMSTLPLEIKSQQVVSVSLAVHNLKCEVCGAQFETRRGLSSHARSHLRQLGISASEGSGAPIDLLYQIAKERNVDGQISSLLLEPLSAKISSPSAPQKDEDLEDMDLDEKPIPLSVLAKAAKAVPPSCSSTPTPSPGASPALPHSGSPSSVVRKAPISSLLPVSSPLRSPEHKAGGMKSLTSNLSGPAAITTTKPLWAPQENDAPLNLSKCHSSLTLITLYKVE